MELNYRMFLLIFAFLSLHKFRNTTHSKLVEITEPWNSDLLWGQNISSVVLNDNF